MTMQRQTKKTDQESNARNDIAVLKQANRELRDRLDMLSCLLDNLPGMAFRCLHDKQLTFEYASQGAQTILGYDPERITSGLAFRQMVHREDQANNKKVIAGLTPENNKYDLTYRMKAAWGENRWIHEQGVAIFTDDGELVAIEGLLTDITEQKLRELQLHAENDRLRSSIKERYRLGQLIGKSPAMQHVYGRIVKAAQSAATVIINGESGTGKELAARAIHELSDRKTKPFIPVNCGAISESLLESEFFGHLRGAFSGAYSDRDGFLKAADGGTLFLDEIGEMPLALQVKLLRVLDGKGFTPVGGNSVLSADFRLISATNRDLTKMVQAGKMREDFYYRINTVPILMPPLQQRIEDLPLLVEHFVNLYSEGDSESVQLTPDFYQVLNQYSWPGNVRELQNVIRRYLTLKEISFSPLADRKNSSPEHLSISTLSGTENRPVADTLAVTEKEIIRRVLTENRWHMGRTAEALGVSRRTLQRKVNKFKLR